MDEPPGHAADLKLAARRRGDRAGEFAPGDRVVCYSPNRRYSASHALRAKDRLQAFTAIGTVSDGAPYRADMGAGFHPYRRDVTWHDAEPTPLAALQGVLAITQERNWGYRLRQGLVELLVADERLAVDEADFGLLIAAQFFDERLNKADGAGIVGASEGSLAGADSTGLVWRQRG